MGMLRLCVAVRLFGDDGRFLEIMRGRRRRRLPVQALRAPGIRAGYRPIANGPQQIDERNQVPNPENRGSGGRHYVEQLEFRWIDGVAARHSQIAEHVLRKKGQIEADKNYQCREARPAIVIEPSGYLWTPVVDALEIRHHRGANHDVVKVGDHEVGVVQMDIGSHCGEKETGETTHREQPNEAERVKHWRLVGDRAFVKGRGPIENFDRRRNSHREAECRENKSRVHGLSGHKHMVAPDEETDHRNGHTRISDEHVTERLFSGEAGDQFADHAHSRKNHDVDRRMGIKPEEVLKQNRVSTNGRIENSDVKDSLKHYHEQRDSNYRRSQDADDAPSLNGPKKKLHALPSQARSAHFMNGHDEIQTGKDGGKSVYKNARRRGDHVRGEVVTA